MVTTMAPRYFENTLPAAGKGSDPVASNDSSGSYDLSMVKLVPLLLNERGNQFTLDKRYYNHLGITPKQFLSARTVLAAAFERGDLEVERQPWVNPIDGETETVHILYEAGIKTPTFLLDIYHIVERDLRVASKFLDEEHRYAVAFLPVIEKDAGWRVQPGWLFIREAIPGDVDAMYSFLKESMQWLHHNEDSRIKLESARKINRGEQRSLASLLQITEEPPAVKP